MRKFNEFVQEKDTLEPLATILLEKGIDVVQFCDIFLETAEKTQDEEVILNELLSTLANMGRGAMNAVGNAFGSVAKGVGQGAAAAGRYVGNAAQNAGANLQQSAQPIANSYMQGAQGGQIKQATATLQSLQQQLKAMKFIHPEVDTMLRRIYLTLQRGSQNLQGNNNLRFGVGDKGVWRKGDQTPPIPTASFANPADAGATANAFV